MTHQVGPKQRKGNDKERIQTKYTFAKLVIGHQRRGHQWWKLGLPVSALMFKKSWSTSVTMNNSQRRRAPLPLYLQTLWVLILHVTRVLMYASTVTAKEFVDIDISGFGRNSHSDMWTFRNCDVERFEIQTGDIKIPPNRTSMLGTFLWCWVWLPDCCNIQYAYNLYSVIHIFAQ